MDQTPLKASLWASTVGTVAAVALVLSQSGCTLLVDLSELGTNAAASTTSTGGTGAGGAGGGGGEAQGGTSAGGTGGVGAGGGGAMGVGCPTDGPPNAGPTEMVRIPDSRGDYCIDTLETTFLQYLDYLQNGGVEHAESGDYDPAHRGWNDDPIPAVGSGWDGWWNRLDDADVVDDLGDPARLVDWCDAKAYCSFYGKRLCGARGGGAPVDPMREGWGDAEFKSDAEWGYACSSGINDYPMGTQPPAQTETCESISGCATWPDTAACGTEECGLQTADVIVLTEGSTICADGKSLCSVTCTDNWIEQSEPVGSHPRCSGSAPPRDRILDMVGSAAEWTEVCDAEAASSEDTRCYTNGGHMYFAGQYNQCDSRQSFARDSVNQWNGIRCCADAE